MASTKRKAGDLVVRRRADNRKVARVAKLNAVELTCTSYSGPTAGGAPERFYYVDVDKTIGGLTQHYFTACVIRRGKLVIVEVDVERRSGWYIDSGSGPSVVYLTLPEGLRPTGTIIGINDASTRLSWGHQSLTNVGFYIDSSGRMYINSALGGIGGYAEHQRAAARIAFCTDGSTSYTADGIS